MSITYRQHQDTRDGKIYNCVLMPDGKWWSADDYRYDGSEWVSPPNNYYWDDTLAAARLYRRTTLTIPPGAHLPTAAEWTAMGTATGTLSDSKPLRSAQGWDSLRAGTDDYGFGMIGANGSPYPGLSWGDTGFAAMLLSANGLVVTGGNPGLSIDNQTTPPDHYASVRFIVDVFNEPIPPTKIKGTFSGSGVKVFCTNYNTPTFELPLSAQTTTELTIKKDFIATWGAALGNVRILVVDGEYISDWKDWNFNA